ncbi:MAG: fluoride efflux transporter FluC [Brevinema sp.]
MDFVFVFLGGGVGSLLRYLITKQLYFVSGWVGILIVNILGSFLLGICYQLSTHQIPQDSKLFLMTGLLGGFTTFSTLQLNLYELFFLNQTPFWGLIVIFLSLSLGLGAFTLGVFLIK